MAESRRYDAVVIGAGQGGGPLASALASAGRSCALVEREHVGGTCVNTGCTPTKTMIASARVAYLARRGRDYGVHTGEVSVDVAKVRERKRAVVESFRAGSQGRIEATDGLDLLFGEAAFTGPKAIRVALNGGGEVEIEADLFVINTGLRTATPHVEGIEHVGALDNESIEELDEAPEHLIVLGGSYLALEFGQMFRRFGSRVTIVQHGDQLMPHEDPDIADELAKILREDGIEVLLETSGTAASREDGVTTLSVQGPDGERELRGSHLLAATGRTPNTEALNLSAAGVDMNEHGYIEVNERLETSAPGIYAIGDVTGGPAFTHISYDDYRILNAILVEGKQASTTGRILPYTVFTDPQLGRIGITETEARESDKQVKVARMPMASVARALEVDEPRGLMKAVVDAETDRILGCAVLGVDGGEVASMLQIAMMGDLPYTALRDGIFSHPTLSESLNNLFATLE